MLAIEKIQLDFTLGRVKLTVGRATDPYDTSGKKPSSVLYGGVKLDLSISDFLENLLAHLKLGEVIPDEFIPDIRLTDVWAGYAPDVGTLSIIAVATVNKQSFRIFFQTKPTDPSQADPKKTEYIFGVLTDLSNFSELPFVGETLKDVQLKDVGLVYASTDQSNPLPQLRDMTAKRPPKDVADNNTPNAQYKQGLNLVGSMQFVEDGPLQQFVLPVQKKPQNPPKITEATQDNAELAASEGSLNDGNKWFNLNKSVGPVTLQKAGLGYTDGRVRLVLSGSVKVSAFSLSLEGLGVSFVIADLFKRDFSRTKFELTGLGFAFSKPPVRISAMFFRIPLAKDSDETISFYGAAQVQLSKFGVSGFGAYSKLKDGSDSFFIYAMYNGALGGTDFCFVTGIAVGFGYNRGLRMPTIREVRNFPLVAMALNPDPKKTQNDILVDLVNNNWIPASPGTTWFAAGIKFTSYNLIESFALVAVEVGASVEFAIVGLSVLRYPKTENPLVYVELALLARYSPSKGYISVEAMLMNSYIFDKNCVLTGGFAFYIWTGGEHQGDFVLTLGGYHPDYKVPDHYPQVDRVGLRWQLSSVLSIVGELYFALTPRAIMAGGRWQALFDIGFLKASLTIWANFLMEWAPLKYNLDAGISVHIDARIKFVRFHVEIGAQLTIWGPPFAGEAKVSWIVYKFTIPFGASKRELPPPLKWIEFQETFVPKTNDNKPDVVKTRVVAGALRVLKDEKGEVITTFVNPYQLVLQVDSFFPLENVNYGSEPLPGNTLMQIAGQDAPITLSERNKKLGIKPMATSELGSALTIEVKPTGTGNTAPTIQCIAQARNMPNALWSGNHNDPDVLENVLGGVDIHMVEPEAAIVEVPTTQRAEQKFQKQIGYSFNKDARSRESSDAIRNIISNNTNSDIRRKISAELGNLGFDVLTIDGFEWEDLSVDTPLYLAAIGQKIPKIEHV